MYSSYEEKNGTKNFYEIYDKKYSIIYHEKNSIQKLNAAQYKCNEERNDNLILTNYYTRCYVWIKCSQQK